MPQMDESSSISRDRLEEKRSVRSDIVALCTIRIARVFRRAGIEDRRTTARL